MSYISSFVENYSCPLTSQIMSEPVIAEDNMTYEREAIEEWIRKNGTSPTNPGQRLTIDGLRLNFRLKQIIQEFLEQHRASIDPKDIYTIKVPQKPLQAKAVRDLSREKEEKSDKDSQNPDPEYAHLAQRVAELSLVVERQSAQLREQAPIVASEQLRLKGELEKQRVLEEEKLQRERAIQEALEQKRRSEQERRQKIALLKIQFQQTQVIDAQTQANEMLLKQCVAGYLPPSSLGANFDPARKDSNGLFPLEVALWSLNMHLVLHIEKLLGEEKTQALWELLISKGISEASIYQIPPFSRVDIGQIDNWYLETKNTAAERIYNETLRVLHSSGKAGIERYQQGFRDTTTGRYRGTLAAFVHLPSDRFRAPDFIGYDFDSVDRVFRAFYQQRAAMATLMQQRIQRFSPSTQQDKS